ncbi:response regulator [Haloechinothrix alba]|uniref:response regulator n=1 Tax=Haloechinothrix alba TaxID=664784 RepID=UPI001FE96E62|nr:response regulator transcription factor [Haloechinothrix alba]
MDDQTLVRQGIRSLLDLAPEVDVAAEAGDGDEALDVIGRELPDVVLLDLRMPGRDGIATLTELRERGIDVPTLVLTTFDDDELVLGALRAGARGYLLKDVTLEALVSAIRTLAEGDTLVEPTMTYRLARSVPDLPSAEEFDEHPAPHPLTGREREILRLLAAGYANREIASALHLTEGTVKNHVSSLLMKLEVRDRTRAVLRALHQGLLSEADGTASGGPAGGFPGER